MRKIQQAAGKRKSHAEIGAIKDKYEKESVELDEAGMGILDSDQSDILQGIVMRNKNKSLKSLLSVVLKSGYFKGVDKKELLGYIDGARQFVKYMKSHPMESVNEAKKPVEIKLQGITFGKDYQGLSFKNGGVQYYYQKGKGAKHVESDYGKFIVKIGQLVTPATREKVAKKLKESVNEAKKYDTYTIIRKYSPTSKQYKIYVQTSHRLLPQHKKNIKKSRSPENWEIWGHDGPDFYGPNKKGAKLVFSGATNEVKLNEDNIKFSKEEMAQLHKDGKIEKGGHTIEFGESVNEAIKPQGYSQLNRSARTLPSDIKDFLKALKKQDDDAVEREILYLKAQFDTFTHILKDKKYTESISEAKPKSYKFKFKCMECGKSFLKSLKKSLEVKCPKCKSVDIELENINESDLGLTYKKGKTVKVTHKKSGKELIIIDKPNVRKEYEKIGFFAEGTVNEAMTMAPFSSQEAKQHINQDIKKMSKHLGKASQQSIKIMMNGVKSGKYTAMDISRGIKEGPAGRAHYGELGFLQQLWNKVRDGFRRYSKDRKLS